MKKNEKKIQKNLEIDKKKREIKRTLEKLNKS